MADYKVIDAEKLDADLTTVADAIREKGGTTEPLEFPLGMKTAVEAIQSGGGSGNIPKKGFVPTEWSDDGYVTKGTLYGITEIQAGYFMRNTNSTEASFFAKLESVDFYEDIVILENNVFANLSNLLMSELPSTIKSIGSACFRGCSKIAFETIPDVVSAIGGNTFMNCRELKINKLPSSLTTIESYAFQNCSKITISEIPVGVTFLGTQCFSGCTGMTSITFKGTPQSIQNNVFQLCNSLLDIYVPWSEGEVANAPWGATKATIHYNTNV